MASFLLVLLTLFSVASGKPSLRARNVARFLQSAVQLDRHAIVRPKAANQLDGCLGPSLFRPLGLFRKPEPLGPAGQFAVDQVFIDSIAEFDVKATVMPPIPKAPRDLFAFLHLSFADVVGGGALWSSQNTTQRFLFVTEPFKVALEMKLLMTEVEIKIDNIIIAPLRVTSSVYFFNLTSDLHHHRLNDFMTQKALNTCLQHLSGVLRSLLSKQLHQEPRTRIENGSTNPRAIRTTRDLRFWNLVVDQLTDQLKKKIERLRSLPLPEFTGGFSKKILFVTISGGASFFSGKVRRISSLRRYRNIVLKSGGSSKEYSYIDIPLEMTNLEVSYQSRLFFTFITIRPLFAITVDKLRLHLHLRSHSGSLPEVIKVQITSLERIDVHVKNFGFFDWIFSAIATLLTNSLRGVIIPPVEDALVGIINGLDLQVLFK